MSTEARGSSTAGGSAAHILRVAARLFAARGYDATPVRLIVEEAGVTKPTLYYYFKSKEGLGQALLTIPMTRLVSTIDRIADGPGGPADRLGEYIEAHFEFCREDEDRARFLYAVFFGPLGSGLGAEIAGFAERMGAGLGRLIGRLTAAGMVPAADAPRLRQAVDGLVVIHTLDYLYKGIELEPGLGRRLVDDLLRGFGPPAGGREGGGGTT